MNNRGQHSKRCGASFRFELIDPEYGGHSQRVYFDREYFCDRPSGHDGHHSYVFYPDTDPAIRVDGDASAIKWPELGSDQIDRRLPKGWTGEWNGSE